MKAKAAVYTGINKPFEIREFELTAPPLGMAKIKLVASGVCGTDLHIHKGKLAIPPPMIIGHEFVGQVEELSAEDSKKYNINIGENVIVDIACPCGECKLCRDGDDANCVNMGVTNGGNPDEPPHLWGGYSEYNYSPVQNLIKIPSELNPKTTSVYACAGPTVIHAFQLAERANCNLHNAQTAVVQGLGPVGTFAVLYLAAMKIPNIIAMTAGNTPKREELAYKLGATKVIGVDETVTDADLVFEASGNPAAFVNGMNMLRNRGVYLVPGQYSNSGGVEIQPQLITFKALHIIGSSQYSISDVKMYIEFLKNNQHLCTTIDELITEYKVEDVNKAFADINAGKNVKTILVP
ncbi:MAG: alcohol dehydrogenase catalytic domain-containing protein [Oscillospiraceae bacterium]|nr:alcohol dehydrogenase catalytic domain-containing protein [Oscillospiraceae bacterium]